MAQKCVHKACGKVFTDPDEPCHYHPRPPKFHEGQKGWECCKPRVLTFDEFLSIPPCTTGKHSTIEDTPQPSKPSAATVSLPSERHDSPPTAPRLPIQSAAVAPQPAPPPEESESDDASLEIKDGQSCRRRGCSAKYTAGASREGEECAHHPGQALFHEGSKGWTCCKRRVLEFDEFMKIPGCRTKARHLFVGSGAESKSASKDGVTNNAANSNTPGAAGGEDPEGYTLLPTVRHDFYQTPTTVIASLFLKKIVKESAEVDFRADNVLLDLRTADRKRYAAEVPLFARIDPAKSSYSVLGTKLELSLVKADGASWPVLRSDERRTGEILQVGRAGTV